MTSEIAKALSRKAERELLADLVAELRELRATSTDAMARRKQGSSNSVLLVETFIIPTSGMISRDFGTPIGCVVVTNPGANTVTVVAGGPQGSAPTVGVGVTVVPAASWLTVPISAPAFTLYGTATDTVSVQAFTGMQGYGVDR